MTARTGFEDYTPLFVFGTLREGLGNNRMLAPIILQSSVGSTTQGKMYRAGHYSHRMGQWINFGYPVVDFREEGTIVGDLFWLKYKDPYAEYERIGAWQEGALSAVFSMEEGAGYTVCKIRVATGYGPEYDAYAFGWEREERGDWIPSGDWKQASMGVAR